MSSNFYFFGLSSEFNFYIKIKSYFHLELAVFFYVLFQFESLAGETKVFVVWKIFQFLSYNL